MTTVGASDLSTLIRNLPGTIGHAHDSGVYIDIDGRRGTQVRTYCLAHFTTFRRIDDMNEMLKQISVNLLMEDSEIEYARVDGSMWQRNKQLTFGRLSRVQCFATNVALLENTGNTVFTPRQLDPNQTFELHRTEQVIFVPCKHLLGHCADDPKPTLRIGPDNQTFVDWLNMWFVH